MEVKLSMVKKMTAGVAATLVFDDEVAGFIYACNQSGAVEYRWVGEVYKTEWQRYVLQQEETQKDAMMRRFPEMWTVHADIIVGQLLDKN